MKNIPVYEKQLNNEFNKIYKELSELKNNRRQYIDSKQIYSIYNKFLDFLNELSIIRKDEEIKGMKLELPNLNDSLIDDIWQLLSLCFITCGLTKFAPATYSSLSTVNKLLTHLKDGKLFTIDDLKPIAKRLNDIKEIIDTYNYEEEDDDDEYDEGDVKDKTQKNPHNEQINYIRKKYNKCEALLEELTDKIKELPDNVKNIYNQLLTLRRNLINFIIDDNSKDIHQNIKNLKSQIEKVESMRDASGHFDCDAASQSVLNGLLDDCNNLFKDLNINKGKDFNELFNQLSLNSNHNEKIANLKKLYNQLIDIKLNLENLLITRRWTLRETDLYNYQNDLKKIEATRISLMEECSLDLKNDLNFKNVQVLLLYLLRRCYSLIYKLLESSEPVSESLQPIHNQLSTVRRCLLDIKRIDGLNNLRELYPFQFKLASLDNLRNDGKFIINNQIPEGQGTLNALLAECFDIIHELKIELEAKEEQQEEEQQEHHTDDEDINSDDEVELKRNRYVEFNEADYNQSEVESLSETDIGEDGEEFEANDYY